MPILDLVPTPKATPAQVEDGMHLSVTPRPTLLLVDDNPTIRSTLSQVLQGDGFDLVTAPNVNDALKCIAAQTFDVLLSDLHMPQAGDGLTVVSAMRHSNPRAVTIIFSAYPEMQQATAAILLQADDILVKPMGVELLLKTIRGRLAQGANPGRIPVESVANMLEQQTDSTIKQWLERVECDEKVTVRISAGERRAYLPQLFRDLVNRLRNPLPLGTRALVSASAAAHGLKRREQGYTAAMLVEESRMLQVSIFQTLQNNLHKIDFSLLLVGVMAIADEVDSQLAQQMACYVSEAAVDGLPSVA